MPAEGNYVIITFQLPRICAARETGRQQRQLKNPAASKRKQRGFIR
jgi:hypothetical protein